ncbi:MAG TPA: hypothetical protein VM597_19985 [Gemmataceae bacterium]|nr:hypothetical protein [Gemmataceae bacterium]
MSACMPADDFPPESWLQIRVLPCDVPGAVRVRQWLKVGLRSFGVRAVRVSGVPPEVVSEKAEEIRDSEGN